MQQTMLDYGSAFGRTVAFLPATWVCAESLKVQKVQVVMNEKLFFPGTLNT